MVLIDLSFLLGYAVFVKFVFTGLTRLLLHFLDHLKRLLGSYDCWDLLDGNFLGIWRRRGFTQVWIDSCGSAGCRVNYHHILWPRAHVLLFRKHLLSLIEVLWDSAWLLRLLVWLSVRWFCALLDEIWLLNGWACVLLRFFTFFRLLLLQILCLETEALHLFVRILSDWAKLGLRHEL